MSQSPVIDAAYEVGRFFVSDVYAFYQDTYKGSMGKVQVEVLDYLSLSDGASIKEVAGRLNISKQHASKIMGRLEELGYVSKSRDPNDGRSYIHQLTEKGSVFVAGHIEQSNRHLLEYLGTLEEGDREEMASSLQRIAKILRGGK